MTNPLKITLLSATLAALLLPAAAQTSTAPQSGSTTPAATPQTTAPATPAPTATPAPATDPAKTNPSVGLRKDYQQDRISKGIANGSLTTKESGTLEKEESNLNHEETDMRKLDNGKLTAADKAALQQQQNKLSKQIYQDKHNAASEKMNMTGKVGEAQDQQQQRIAQGVKSGQLTSAETNNLENKENAIDKEVAKDRSANGGALTAQEKSQVRAQQNKVSKQIYKDKHNNSKR
jgi:hypothetical protein